MDSYRTNARIAGVLFITASALAIIGGALILPIDDPGYLADAAAKEGQIVTGAVLEVLLAVSVFGIAVALFPVLRRQNEGAALGYVGVRIVEGTLILLASVSGLLVLSLSKEFTETGDSGLQPLGDLLLMTRDWTYLIGTMVFLGFSALVLYTLLYRSRLVPTWLSIWGLAGGALIVARGLLEMFGNEFSGVVQGIFAAPIAVQEMVLAVWLIVRGFDLSRLDRVAETRVPASEAELIKEPA
jgi:hypothetical protein